MSRFLNQEGLAERRTKYHEADVVVVGAGVFGCAVAHTLANQGRSVILLERWLKEPDRIVGELLQPGGYESLRKLGLEQCVEGIDAVPCSGMDVIYYGQDMCMDYPLVGKWADAAKRATATNGKANGTANGYANGKANGHANGSAHTKHAHFGPQGRSFKHGRFITQLRKACFNHPNITIFETEAVSAIKGDHGPEILGVQTQTTDPETREKKPDCFFGQLTIIADGYASKFRKQYIGRTPMVKSKFYALELVDCDLPHSGYGHVVIGGKTLVLLYQIGTKVTRALVNVPEKLPEASPAVGGVRGYLTNVVLPQLPPSIQPSFQAALERDGKIPQSMPNSWLPPTKQGTFPGLVLLGDAMNMRHPLTGGGMTVALNDVVLLADELSPERIAELGDTAAVARAMARFHSRRKNLTSIINVLAQALYSLFAAEDANLAKLQRGCFEYFRRGHGSIPMGFLGGLLHRPGLLAYHFFSVAFLAIWLDWKEAGLWLGPLLLLRAVSILWTASVVFLPVMYRELFA
ncbi:squalene epoxidase [Xylariomycetidae sp. FL0641]|nr:squalene epoxidase [Xylariomycetidae sp. FL0641]